MGTLTNFVDDNVAKILQRNSMNISLHLDRISSESTKVCFNQWDDISSTIFFSFSSWTMMMMIITVILIIIMAIFISMHPMIKFSFVAIERAMDGDCTRVHCFPIYCMCSQYVIKFVIYCTRLSIFHHCLQYIIQVCNI